MELKGLDLQYLKCSNPEALKNGISSMFITECWPLSIYKAERVISSSEHHTEIFKGKKSSFLRLCLMDLAIPIHAAVYDK